MRFENKHVIVTGGGRGIGEAIGRRFAAEGADVLVMARTESEVAAVAESIRDSGGSARHELGDVSNSADVDRIVSGAEQRWDGRIDVVVNNAGIDDDCPFLEVQAESWQRVIGVNLTGPFLCRSASPRAWPRAAAAHSSTSPRSHALAGDGDAGRLRRGEGRPPRAQPHHGAGARRSHGIRSNVVQSRVRRPRR